MEEQIKGIYVDLDSIFDTRLGVIAELDPSLVEVVFDEKYLFRKTDIFPVLKKETFDELYKLRDYDTLKVSPYTAIFDVVNSIISKLLESAVAMPDISGVKLYVNIYPYKLSKEFIGDLLELFVTRTGKLVYIEIIDKSETELTFSYCVDKFDFLIMYDYNTFLESNVKTGEHKKTNLNDRVLIAPEIYHREFSKSELDSLYRKNPALNGKSTADILKMIASPAVILELTDALSFSTDIKLYTSERYAFKPEAENTDIPTEKAVEEKDISVPELPEIVHPEAVKPTVVKPSDDFLA